MPKIPTYDNFQVSEQGLPAARVNTGMTPEQASLGGRQMMQTGQALLQASHDASGMVSQQLQEANQLRVDDANNRRNELKMKMLYDKDVGLTNIRGIDALERPDGKPLADEYTEKYKQAIADIEGTLGNDAQKQAFRRESEADIVTFYGTATKHEGEQFRDYALSVRKGTIANRINEIGIRYNDPEAIDQALTSIKASAYDEARLLGKSAAEAESYARDLTSKAHTTAIMTALENGQAKYADDYIKKYAKDMTADDILRVNGSLTKELDAQIATEVVNKVFTQATPQIAPTEGQKLTNLVLSEDQLARLDAAKVQAESSGRRYGEDGKLLKGPMTPQGTAKGEHQVMDATARDPGYGVKPAQDDSAEERARVGAEYLQAMLREFNGNVPQALAAYNAGPKNVQDALAAAEKKNDAANWMNYLPKPEETIPYVDKIMKAYAAGGGAPPRPTLLALQNQAREEIGTGHPERLNLALKEIERQYEATTKALKQRDEESVANAMQLILQNGGSYTSLPASVRSAIPASEVPKIMDFAGKIAKGEEPATDWSLYYTLKLNTANLGDINLMAVRNKLADSEFKQLVELQNDVRSGKGDQLAEIRSSKDVLDQFMRESGIDPAPKKGERGWEDKAAVVGKVFNMFEQRVKDRRRTLGRSLNATELRDEAARMFATVDVPGAVYGTNQEPYAATIAKGGRVEIPEDERKRIVDELKAQNLVPTDNVVELIYLRKKGVMP